MVRCSAALLSLNLQPLMSFASAVVYGSLGRPIVGTRDRLSSCALENNRE